MQTAVTRWTPTTDVFRDRLDRMFNQAFGDFLTPTGVGSEDVSTRRWLPAVDIRESDEALTLMAELPGLSREDVNITVENHVLTISGERKFEKDTKEENYHRIERAYGSFARSFTLPSNVKADQVQATFKDGVLTVSLPKVEEAKPRKIAIQ
jgi:HSP20 family protein